MMNTNTNTAITTNNILNGFENRCVVLTREMCAYLFVMSLMDLAKVFNEKTIENMKECLGKDVIEPSDIYLMNLYYSSICDCLELVMKYDKISFSPDLEASKTPEAEGLYFMVENYVRGILKMLEDTSYANGLSSLRNLFYCAYHN